MNLLKLKILKQWLSSLIFLLLAGIQAIAQTGNSTEVYDLSRCVISGLENNYSLKIAKTSQQVSDNNYTFGNAGYLPSITTTNRFGGTMNNMDQSLNDGSKNLSRGIHNNAASANVNLDLTIFRGFQVQTTFQKLGELKKIGELNTQMKLENLESRIIA